MILQLFIIRWLSSPQVCTVSLRPFVRWHALSKAGNSLHTHSSSVSYHLWLQDNTTSRRRGTVLSKSVIPLIYRGTHSVWPPIYTIHFASLEIKWNKPFVIAGMWSALGVSETAIFDLIHWSEANSTLEERVPSWGCCLSTITISMLPIFTKAGPIIRLRCLNDNENLTFPAKKDKSSPPRMWRSSVDSSFCGHKIQEKYFQLSIHLSIRDMISQECTESILELHLIWTWLKKHLTQEACKSNARTSSTCLKRYICSIPH